MFASCLLDKFVTHPRGWMDMLYMTSLGPFNIIIIKGRLAPIGNGFSPRKKKNGPVRKIADESFPLVFVFVSDIFSK